MCVASVRRVESRMKEEAMASSQKVLVTAVGRQRTLGSVLPNTEVTRSTGLLGCSYDS